MSTCCPDEEMFHRRWVNTTSVRGMISWAVAAGVGWDGYLTYGLGTAADRISADVIDVD